MCPRSKRGSVLATKTYFLCQRSLRRDRHVRSSGTGKKSSSLRSWRGMLIVEGSGYWAKVHKMLGEGGRGSGILLFDITMAGCRVSRTDRIQPHHRRGYVVITHVPDIHHSIHNITMPVSLVAYDPRVHLLV